MADIVADGRIPAPTARTSKRRHAAGITGLRWLVATRASFSGGLRTRQLSARCPAQHAVDHYVNGEAKPFVGISSDQLSGVGSN